jgi:hypothetical protein
MLDALFANGAWIFSLPALLGTGIFLIKLAFMLVGGSDDLDLGGDASSSDAGHVHDMTGDAHGVHGHAHNALMAVATVQGVSAFAMGFGWAGLGALNGLKWNFFASAGVGVLGGVLMTALLVVLLAGVRSLQSTGTTNMQTAAGSEGEVYATIPASNATRGQVKLVVQGRARLAQASSKDGTEIATGVRVKVLSVNADNSVVVAKISP